MDNRTLLYIIVLFVNQYTSVDGCTIEEFECSSGECIDADKRCDDEFDCSDQSDEENCQIIVPCPERQYRCGDGQCVNANARCNGVEECSDSSDENNCFPGTSASEILSTVSFETSVVLYQLSSNLSVLSRYPEITNDFQESSDILDVSFLLSSPDNDVSSSGDLFSIIIRSLPGTNIPYVTTTSQLDIYTFKSSNSIKYTTLHAPSQVAFSIPPCTLTDNSFNSFRWATTLNGFNDYSENTVSYQDIISVKVEPTLSSEFLAKFSFSALSSVSAGTYNLYDVTTQYSMPLPTEDISLFFQPASYVFSSQYSPDLYQMRFSYTNTKDLQEITQTLPYSAVNIPQSEITSYKLPTALLVTDQHLSPSFLQKSSTKINFATELPSTTKTILLTFSKYYSNSKEINVNESSSMLSHLPSTNSKNLSPTHGVTTIYSSDYISPVSVYPTTPVDVHGGITPNDKNEKDGLPVLWIILIIIGVIIFSVPVGVLVYRCISRKKARKKEFGSVLSMDMVHPDLAHDKTTRKQMVKTASFTKLHHECHWSTK